MALRYVYCSCFLTLILFVFNGCEKVIQLKTDKIPQKYVIEANISDQMNDCYVILTTTNPINQPTHFDGVSNAKVTIREDEKNPVTLTEIRKGIYQGNGIHAKSGHQYTLKVQTADAEFTSAIKVPEKVNFDSLSIINFEGFGSTRKFANVSFHDPAGMANSYRFIQYKNGIPNPNIFVVNDDFSDGRPINTFLPFFGDQEDQKIISGDTIRVEMQGIDRSVYLYFNSLNQSSSGGNEVVAPGNPITNIKGGALGYFNAFIKQQKTIIVE